MKRHKIIQKIRYCLKILVPTWAIIRIWKWRMKDFDQWARQNQNSSFGTEPPSRHPKAIFIVGMPRTGSSLAKRYLGEYQRLKMLRYSNYRDTIVKLQQPSDGTLLVDKATTNIDKIHKIHEQGGKVICFLGIVRDPRDELASLLETDRHMEIPRDRLFWPYWEFRYHRLIQAFQIILSQQGKVAILRYEDLARNPEKVKAGFLKWIGLEGRNLSRRYNVTEDNIAIGKNISEDWKVHQSNEVHSQSVGRWRNLPLAKRRIVDKYKRNTRSLGLMKSLGYSENGELSSPKISRVPLIGCD